MIGRARPDLSGDWDYAGSALTMDGATLYDWTARVTIRELGDRAEVETRTAKSHSISRAALISRLDDGGIVLIYDYIADPAHEATAGHDFFGVTRFLFDADGQTGVAHYLNYNGRYTHGRMTLTRA